MQTTAPHVFLIGPMAAGKTTVGKYLACLLELPFYDSDIEIEKKTGLSVAEIFARDGEAGFRQQEHDILKSLTTQTPFVLATGGGVVELEENIACLQACNGQVVYLEVSLKEQLKRLTHDKTTRPLFKDLELLNTKRAPRYAALATLRYDTDDCDPMQLATHIWTDLQC